MALKSQRGRDESSTYYQYQKYKEILQNRQKIEASA